MPLCSLPDRSDPCQLTTVITVVSSHNSFHRLQNDLAIKITLLLLVLVVHFVSLTAAVPWQMAAELFALSTSCFCFTAPVPLGSIPRYRLLEILCFRANKHPCTCTKPLTSTEEALVAPHILIRLKISNVPDESGVEECCVSFE